MFLYRVGTDTQLFRHFTVVFFLPITKPENGAGRLGQVSGDGFCLL